MGAGKGRRRPGRTGFWRARHWQVADRRGIGRAAPRRASSPLALLLLALSPEQRDVPVHRAARLVGGVCARRSARGQAAETPSLVGPRRTARRGFGAPRRSAVIAGIAPPSAAKPQSSAEKGKDTGGVDPPARGSDAPPAGGYGLRGCTLDR